MYSLRGLWLLSLSIILRSIHVLICRNSSSLFIAEQYCYGYTTSCLFIHLLMAFWVVSSFWRLQIHFLCALLCMDMCFHFSCVNLQDRNGSCGRCTFNLLKKLPNSFQSLNILHFHPMIVLFAPHCLQHLVGSVFLILLTVIGIQ